MIATSLGSRVNEVAQQLFQVITQIHLSSPRGRRQPGELKEPEYLSLAILRAQGTLTVGDIQRLLGVLPAQMSRVIRSLEERDRPLIGCQINALDKRKVDVCLTPAGEKTLHDHEATRLKCIKEMLSTLREEELDTLEMLLEKMRIPRGQGPVT
jgi:DNA-binding MarR family transcriptional regulator